MRSRLTVALTAICTALVMLSGAHAFAAAPKTVTISGKAYVFNHMDTGISNAPIKVREFPKISTTTNSLGEYEMTVPNDANVTPYIPSGDGLLTKRKLEDDSPNGQVQTHWNEIDLQTFHTRGKDLENVNFQSPADLEYAGLKALLSVPAREDGRPEQCAIVTTSSARNVRGVDYRTFWERTPHGVPGATSLSVPAIPGPTYFNENVIPDKTKTSSSEDGGIIWDVVPEGNYRIITSAPNVRFASFLATCRDGRIINANPPWGAYELSPGEKPLAASNVAGKVTRVKGYRKGRKRFVSVRIVTAETLTLGAVVQGRMGVGILSSIRKKIKPGTTMLRLRVSSIPRKVPGKVHFLYDLEDASGVSFGGRQIVKVPKLKKKVKKHRQR